jgi:hypothetical protein
MESIIEQITQLPNGDNILCLFSSAKQKLGNNALAIRDYNEYGESYKPKNYGRYERDKGIIWIQMRHPVNVVEYCLAHEIGHVMQDAAGFPWVSIKDILRNCKFTPLPDIIIRIHQLSGYISNLLLDPGADLFARANSLISRDALLYMKQKDLESISDIYLPEFDRKRLTDGIKAALNSVKCGTRPCSPQDMRLLLETARFALIYALLSLRYSEEGLFDSLDRKYKQNQIIIHKLGNELLDIRRQHELNTIIGCQEAAKCLIANLQLPSEAIGIRTSQGWLT